MFDRYDPLVLLWVPELDLPVLLTPRADQGDQGVPGMSPEAMPLIDLARVDDNWPGDYPYGPVIFFADHTIIGMSLHKTRREAQEALTAWLLNAPENYREAIARMYAPAPQAELPEPVLSGDILGGGGFMTTDHYVHEHPDVKELFELA